MVVRLCDDFWVSHFDFQIKPELTVKMPGKCSFQDCCLKDSAYQVWVLKEELDKHYT